MTESSLRAVVIGGEFRHTLPMRRCVYLHKIGQLRGFFIFDARIS